MKYRSVAQINVVILILSLLPFIIGLSVSVSRSSNREYFSAAINIAGSQRMRTMLISNYGQQIVAPIFENKDSKENLIILTEELDLYRKYFDALIYGDTDLGMKANKFTEIYNEMKAVEPLVNQYIEYSYAVIRNPEDKNKVVFIVQNAMVIKNHFHDVTELYQAYNDRYISQQKRLDIIMIIFATIITLGGLLLTRKIKQQAFNAAYDYLTQLKNRHSLLDYIKEKHANDFSIYFIDLNKFKVINDTYGHETGDIILVGVADRLRMVFGTDTLFRYGGDEFIALSKNNKMNNLENDQAIDEKIKAVKQLLSEPIVDPHGRNHYVGLSMGVVSSSVGIEDWKELINLSDDLMYDSKGISGHVIVYRRKSDLENRLQFLKSIDDIIEKGIIKLDYQPIYSVCDDSISIYNVTSRWEDKNQVFIATEFLPTLKRKGYLAELDMHALSTLELHDQQNEYDDSTNKNARYVITISEDTLLYSHSNNFMSVLEALNIPNSKVIIKIQEGLLRNSKIQKVINQIKSMGFALAVDNFTIDLSLKETDIFKEIEVVKIENSLVHAVITQNNGMNSILKEFIHMLVASGKTVIIEGANGSDLRKDFKELCESFGEKILYTNTDE